MINREKGERGFCRSGSKSAVYSYSPHHGEEPPISGTRGSGTIFFTHCSMRCVYCQNHTFSQKSDQRESRAPQRQKVQTARGYRRDDFEEIETEELAGRMLELQNAGCHNINLVSPTHYACRIAEALDMAAKNSLNIPVIYNTGGYDSPELIKLLDGIIDIYMPDMRYSSDDIAQRYSSAPGYVENNRLIIKEMFRQAGPLKIKRDGIAEKGVIVRLLILPGNASGTIETLRFLKKEVSTDIYLSVMSQYYPAYKAAEYPEIAGRIKSDEYEQVIEVVRELGFENGWIQGFLTDTDRFLGTNIKPGR